MLGAVEVLAGVALKPNGAALEVVDVVLDPPVGLKPKAGVVVAVAGVDVDGAVEGKPVKPPVVDVEAEGWVVEGAVGLKLNMLLEGVVELVVVELEPVVELAPKANPTVGGAEVLGGLSLPIVVMALVNNVLPV